MKVIKDFGEIQLGSREYDSRKTRLHVKLVKSSTRVGQHFLMLQRNTTNGDQKPMYLPLDSLERLASFILLSKPLMVDGSNEKPALFVEEKYEDWPERKRKAAPWLGPIATSDLSSAGIGKATEGEVKRE